MSVEDLLSHRSQQKDPSHHALLAYLDRVREELLRHTTLINPCFNIFEMQVLVLQDLSH